MAKAENGETYEKLLLGKLQRVIDFLKFAEAKNAALLTLSSALTIATGNLLLNASVPTTIARGLVIALPLAMAAGLLAIASFVPRLCLPTFLGGHRAGPHPKNLLYFDANAGRRDEALPMVRVSSEDDLSRFVAMCPRTTRLSGGLVDGKSIRGWSRAVMRAAIQASTSLLTHAMRA